MVYVPVASVDQVYNMQAQRPDLFIGNRAVLEHLDPAAGTMALNCIDQAIADEIIALDENDPRPKLLNYAAGQRFMHETGGIMVQGHPILTDIASQSKVADLNNGFTSGATTGVISFKCADGSFWVCGAPEVLDIFNSMQSHIQACYTCEMNATDAINAGTATTPEAVDAYFASVADVHPPAAALARTHRTIAAARPTPNVHPMPWMKESKNVSP